MMLLLLTNPSTLAPSDLAGGKGAAAMEAG